MDISIDFLRSVRAVVTDMDGTIFGPGMIIPQSTLEGLKDLAKFNEDEEKKGNKSLFIIPATGRCSVGVQKALKECGAAGKLPLFPGVYLNGCLTYGPGGAGDLVYHATVEKDVLRKVISLVNKINSEVMAKSGWEEMEEVKNAEISHGFYPVTDKSLQNTYLAIAVYSGDPIVCESKGQLVDGLDQFGETTAVAVGSLEEYCKDHPVSKILVISHSKITSNKIRPQFEACCGDEVDIVTAVPRILELVPKGVNKSIALSHLCNKLNISMNQVFALGDGENDYELLKNTGFSVAMKEAPERVQAAASYVTGSINENGWGIAVQTLLQQLRGLDEVSKIENRCN